MGMGEAIKRAEGPRHNASHRLLEDEAEPRVSLEEALLQTQLRQKLQRNPFSLSASFGLLTAITTSSFTPISL